VQVAVYLETTATVVAASAQTPTEATWHHWFEQWLIILAPDISPIYAYEVGVQLMMRRFKRSTVIIARLTRLPTFWPLQP
jgi:hypothetical protein